MNENEVVVVYYLLNRPLKVCTLDLVKPEMPRSQYVVAKIELSTSQIRTPTLQKRLLLYLSFNCSDETTNILFKCMCS